MWYERAGGVMVLVIVIDMCDAAWESSASARGMGSLGLPIPVMVLLLDMFCYPWCWHMHPSFFSIMINDHCGD